jgi:phosphoserine phosphatase RsbX
VDESPTPLFLEWGVAARPLRGETKSGDVAVVRFCRETALIAACDGLGHGADAARAAAAAAAALETFGGEDVVSVARRCDEALRTTRGAAISLAVVAAMPAAVTWVGVGNVEGRLLRGSLSAADGSRSLILQPGIAGEGLPSLHAVTVAIGRGDTLIFATDGVDSRFADWLVPVGAPQSIAERILDQHSKSTDDALVVVARYLGSRP